MTKFLINLIATLIATSLYSLALYSIYKYSLQDMFLGLPDISFMQWFVIKIMFNLLVGKSPNMEE